MQPAKTSWKTSRNWHSANAPTCTVFVRYEHTLSYPLQNLPYQSKMFVRDSHSLPYAFCNILNIFVAVNSFLKQNLILCAALDVSIMTDEKKAYKNIY